MTYEIAKAPGSPGCLIFGREDIPFLLSLGVWKVADSIEYTAPKTTEVWGGLPKDLTAYSISLY